MRAKKKLTNYLNVVKRLYLELLHYHNLLRSFKILKVCLGKDPKFVQDLVGAGMELCKLNSVATIRQ